MKSCVDVCIVTAINYYMEWHLLLISDAVRDHHNVTEITGDGDMCTLVPSCSSRYHGNVSMQGMHLCLDQYRGARIQ